MSAGPSRKAQIAVLGVLFLGALVIGVVAGSSGIDTTWAYVIVAVIAAAAAALVVRKGWLDKDRRP